MTTPPRRVLGGVAAAPVAVAAVVGCGLSGTDKEYTDHSDDVFTMQIPEAWEAEETDPEDLDEGQHVVQFSHPDGEHVIEVGHWSSDELLSASANARSTEEQTLGWVDDPDHPVSDYERIEIRREEPDDHPDGWDVAYFERETTNDSWTTPERHITTWTVSVGGEENYTVLFNLPAEAADDYAGVREHVFDSFEPR